MDDLDPVGKILNIYWRLTPEEKEACKTGLAHGYVVIPRATTGLLWLYYGTVCVLNRQPVVALMPERAGKRKLLVSLPTKQALPRVALLAVDAGVAVVSVCPFRMGLVGLIEAKRAEPVAKLISKRASFWCATYLGVTYDVH